MCVFLVQVIRAITPCTHTSEHSELRGEDGEWTREAPRREARGASARIAAQHQRRARVCVRLAGRRHAAGALISLGDAKSSLGDAKSSLGDANPVVPWRRRAPSLSLSRSSSATSLCPEAAANTQGGASVSRKKRVAPAVAAMLRDEDVESFKARIQPCSDRCGSLSVTQRALSVTQRALSDTQRALSVTQRALSDTQRALSVSQRAQSEANVPRCGIPKHRRCLRAPSG